MLLPRKDSRFDEGGGGDMKDTEVRGDQMGRHRISDGLNAKQYCIQWQEK